MKCPFCSAMTDVIDSRPDHQNSFVRRRRACMSEACGMRFTTLEVPTISRYSSDDITKWVKEQEAAS